MTTKEITGYFRQDDSGHWYLIPEEHVKDYDKLNEYLQDGAGFENNAFYDACAEFDQKFGEFKIDGPYDLKVKTIVEDK